MDKIITAQELMDMDICPPQLDNFYHAFPDGVAHVTEETCLQHAQTFDWSWAARKLLSNEALIEFCEIRDAARTECQNACDAAWAKCEPVYDESWDEYVKVRDAAETEHNKVRAVTFARLFAGGAQ